MNQHKLHFAFRRRDVEGFRVPSSGLWLARNEGMDPYSSPYITHSSSSHALFHSFGIDQVHCLHMWLVYAKEDPEGYQ